MLKKVFKVGDVEYAVLRPQREHVKEGQKVYNKTFSEALQSGAILREKLDDYLTQQGLWDESKEAELKSIRENINKNEKVLAAGGIKKSEARAVSLELKRLRKSLRDLLVSKTSLDGNTAQGQAENARFNSFVSSCTVYNNNGSRYFKSLDDYLDKADSDVALEAANALASMVYGLDSDFESKLPENKVLKDLGFVDEKLRLINKDGHLIDEDGRLINEDGRFVNDKGEFVDINGQPVDKDGNLIVEFSPFLDD